MTSSRSPMPWRRPRAGPLSTAVCLCAALAACGGEGGAGPPVGGTAPAPAATAETLRPQGEAPADVTATVAPDPLDPEALEAAGWRVGTGHQGLHTLAWRPLDRDDVPRNVDFEAEVLLLRDGAPAAGPRLAVSGWMPEHEHGMVRLPVVEDLGEGRYRVSALLLHMRGAWQLRFQIQAGRDTEIVTFDLEV